MDWRPIETAPKDDTFILATDGTAVCCVSFTNGRFCLGTGTENLWVGSDYNGGLAECDWNLTHWMPLPKPTQGGGRDECR